MQQTEILETQSAAQNLIKLIKQLLIEHQYDGVGLLFSSATEGRRNMESLKAVASQMLHEVCLEHLTETNYSHNMPLYNSAEQLLLLLAKHGPAEELILDLLEIVEEQESDNVFTSTLKALQNLLLRILEQRPRALEWTLNSIHSRIAELPVPHLLNDGYDLQQQRLLEEDAEVVRVLMNYITVALFYAPLLVETNAKSLVTKVFRSNSIDSRNVLCCFLVQLLGRPLALLDLSKADDDTTQKLTNVYTLQCACNITKAITECIVDPLYLLSYVEKRVRWRPRLDSNKGVFEMSSHDIFFIEEKLPLVGLAIYYYMLLVEGVSREQIPQVYAPLYIFETGLYLVTELLGQAEPALHYRGILLGQYLLRQLNSEAIPAVQLELQVHKTFCHELCNIVGYSPQQHLREAGVQLLQAYIHQFDDEGKYLILKNLLRSISHTGIIGYLAVLYKDLVASALLASDRLGDAALPSFYCGTYFRNIFLQSICHLPNGVETDLIEEADRLIASLNTVRYFALRDAENRTGFWNFANKIEEHFLSPLQRGLDISLAHYKNEVIGGDEEHKANNVADIETQLVDINIANDVATPAKGDNTKGVLKLERKQKIELLNLRICALDLMRSLLARVSECLESTKLRNSEIKKLCL